MALFTPLYRVWQAGGVNSDGVKVIGQIAKKYNFSQPKLLVVNVLICLRKFMSSIYLGRVNVAGFEYGPAYGKSLRTVKYLV